MKSLIKIKGITSLLLIIFFAISTFSGIGLHFAPLGRVARDSNWTFLIFDKWQLEKIHTNTSFVFVTLVLFHFFLNYKLFLAEIKKLFTT